jgi:hypothetical protein
MRRLIFLLCCLSPLVQAQPAATSANTAKSAPPTQGLVIAVADNPAPDIKSAADKIERATATQQLLKVFAEGKAPRRVESLTLLNGAPTARGFAHLVCVGLPEDPLIQAAWGREARRIDGGLYVFGFGHLRGDIGYIESDRNPFLHSRFIEKVPYETEIVLITGNTPRGVGLAADAFLKGVVNGVVAAPGWTRPATSLLEQTPLTPDFELPANLPQKLGDWQLIGVSQGGADEYRGVLADAGAEPQQIWRGKYYKPGVWDGSGAENAIADYFAGLQRRTYGNTLWLARFRDENEAKAVAPKIAAAANLKKEGAAWRGQQPPYGFEAGSPGPLWLAQHGVWLHLCTISGVEPLP